MKRLLTASLTALALLVGATSVQATPIPPGNMQWNYNFSPGAPAVLADTNATAGISFTNEPTKPAVGSSDIVATNLRVFSAATAASPDALISNGNYSLTLVLSTIEDSIPYSASMTFTGKLSGTFSSENANVSNVFGPNQTQAVALGSYTFTVTLMSYTPPGPPDQVNAGSISAHVAVTSSSITPAQVPEPSTMLLSGLGLSFLGGAALRKRRQAQRDAAAATV